MSRFIVVFALLALIQVSCAKRLVNLEDLMVRNVREVEASGEGSGEVSAVESSGEGSEVEASGEGSGVEASGEGSGEETVEASGEGSGAEEGSGTVVEPLILTDPVPETLNTPILTETI